MHQSIATVNSPEFINLSPLDINPLMSACDIKVFYLGKNDNRSFINKEVATEMAKTLRGCPIVGKFSKEHDDFRDHGERIIIDSEGVKVEKDTKPYGFVAPDAPVWFQEFEEIDRNTKQSVVREYLMTKGYLWTEQMPEAKKVFENGGSPQSMELEEKTLRGDWTEVLNENYELFIISDAVFSQLCILGQDIEPCFEGASVLPTNSRYSLMDYDFTKTLFTMMEDLRKIYPEERREDQMENVQTNVSTEPQVDPVAEPEFTTAEPEIQAVADKQVVVAEPKVSVVADEPTVVAEPSADEPAPQVFVSIDEHNELKARYEALETEVAGLREFKANIEDKEKDAMIEKFYMLDEADKEDVVKNKSSYSLEDIEAKLSVICVRKGLSFTKDEPKESAEIQDSVITYSLDNSAPNSDMPEWLRAVANYTK